jgi:putative transposase
MKYDPDKHHRRSVRLKEYDYSQAGAYFITICAYNRECILGDVVDRGVSLSAVGKIAKLFFEEIPNHFEGVALDKFVVMPNHLHGIITIQNVGVQNFEPLQKQNAFQHIMPKSLGSIIRTYKSAVTHWCRNNGYEHFKWQRNYYERIIRDEDELRAIREYIAENPLKWESDKENPSIYPNP